VFVVRPDSLTDEHKTPEDLVEWILNELWDCFGGKMNKKSFKVLDPHVRVIWGDGIDAIGIKKILKRMLLCNFSAENIVFGMGGNLTQKNIERDTQRFATKASAVYREGGWYDIQKNPLDQSKASKKGRLMLVNTMEGDPLGYRTVPLGTFDSDQDVLQTVLENGVLMNRIDFDQIRENAAA
jgi:nicotinamide phosphoribosyltransferase